MYSRPPYADASLQACLPFGPTPLAVEPHDFKPPRGGVTPFPLLQRGGYRLSQGEDPGDSPPAYATSLQARLPFGPTPLAAEPHDFKPPRGV